MKNKKSLIFVIVLLLLLCGCSYTKYSIVIYENWQISMPNNIKEIYKVQSPASFNGDGIRYHVFRYEDDKNIENWLNFSAQQQATIFADNYQQAINKWFDEMNKKIALPINYDNCLYYYKSQNDNSEIIIILNKYEKLIYVIESFM